MEKDRKPAKTRSKRDRTRPPQAAGRVAQAVWGQVADLRALGKSATDIAIALGRDPSAVARTLKEPAVIADIERIQRDRRQALDQEIRAAAGEAWEVLRSKLLSDREDMQLRAATEILDRAGITAKTAIELSGPGGGPVAVTIAPVDLLSMTPEQLRALAGAVAVELEPVGGEE